ncbi:MAG: hypothetical protein AB7I18_06030 [Candidatus Berkiella sp.]
MSLSDNKDNQNAEDLLNQLTATLKSVQTCLTVFGDNPRYSRICDAQTQKGNGMAQTPTTLLTQFEAMRDTTSQFLTPSYIAENSVRTRQTPKG